MLGILELLSVRMAWPNNYLFIMSQKWKGRALRREVVLYQTFQVTRFLQYKVLLIWDEIFSMPRENDIILPWAYFDFGCLWCGPLCAFYMIMKIILSSSHFLWCQIAPFINVVEIHLLDTLAWLQAIQLKLMELWKIFALSDLYYSAVSYNCWD